MISNPKQEPSGAANERGSACINDWDGDGISDEVDVCPENPDISRIEFVNMQKIDICEAAVKSVDNEILKFCKKEEPTWEERENGTEIFQTLNSRPAVAVIKNHRFEDVEYNGTLFVQDKDDNDWVLIFTVILNFVKNELFINPPGI